MQSGRVAPVDNSRKEERRGEKGRGEKEGKKGEALARTSLEYPLELHRKVKKYAVDAGMKEKQVIAQAIREFFERVEKE